MLFILNFVLLLIGALISQSVSSFTFGLLALFWGYFMIYKVLRNNYKPLFFVFNISFFIYLLATILRYVDVSMYPDIFYKGIDEIHFFKESEGASNISISKLVREFFESRYIENELYYFYIRLISSVSTSLFDGNSIYLQLLGTSLIGSYVSIFMYSILNHFKIANPVNKTILFMLFTCLLPVSVIIHRDSMVAFLYSVSLYIALVAPYSVKNLLFQGCLVLVTFFVREQSGLFIIGILLASMFIHSSGNKWFRLLFICIFLIFLSYATFLLDNLNDTMEYYTQLSKDNASSGLSRYIAQLPIGLKQFFLIIQGQFQPLPIWANFPENPTFVSVLFAILWGVISVFWFHIFSFFLFFVVREYSKMPRNLVIWSLVFLLFLVLNFANADPRRMVCMYPLGYLVYLYLRQYVVLKKYAIPFNKCYYSTVFLFMMLIAYLKV